MTRLQLLCTGTPASLAHRGGSSYLVQTGDETLIFDCGPGSVRRMLEAGLALPSIETPGVQERVLHEVGEVFDGQVILGQYLLEVPLGTIDAEPVR